MCVKLKEMLFNSVNEPKPVRKQLKISLSGINDAKLNHCLKKQDQWEIAPEAKMVNIDGTDYLVFSDGRIINERTGNPLHLPFYSPWQVHLMPSKPLQAAEFFLNTFRKDVLLKSDLILGYTTKLPEVYGKLTPAEWDKAIIIGRTNGNRLCNSLTSITYMLRSHRQFITEISGPRRSKNGAGRLINIMAFYYQLRDKTQEEPNPVVLSRMFGFSQNNTVWLHNAKSKKNYVWADLPPEKDLLAMTIPQSWWSEYEQKLQVRNEELERAIYGC